MIVDRAIYRHGLRPAEPSEPAHMDDAWQAGGALAWVGLCRPTEQQFAAVAHELGLHMLAVGHALMAVLGVALYVLFTRRKWM